MRNDSSAAGETGLGARVAASLGDPNAIGGRPAQRRPKAKCPTWRGPWLAQVATSTLLTIASLFAGLAALERFGPADPSQDLREDNAQLAARNPASAVSVATVADDDPATNLSEFFDSFDLDANGGLSIREAKAFYEWVEENVAYRYDDERRDPTDTTLLIGDGRPGNQYQQTAAETLQERAGDCEDQNGLEVAFYLHWNVLAFVAFVNAVTTEGYDHAVAIVWAAQTRDEFHALMGDAPAYEIKGRLGVPDGFYIIVDNTFSNTFGQVSDGIGLDKFKIHHLATYPDLFLGSRLAPTLPGP